MGDTRQGIHLKKIRLFIAVCVIFCFNAQGVRAGERPEIQFREEGTPSRPAAAGTSLENHGAQFNPDAFFQSKTPALTDPAANLDAPQVGRAADAEMFFFFILAVCVVGFLGLVVFSATRKRNADGMEVRRNGPDGENFLPELLERRRRRRSHPSRRADASSPL
jgi:hypothetical protein